MWKLPYSRTLTISASLSTIKYAQLVPPFRESLNVCGDRGLKSSPFVINKQCLSSLSFVSLTVKKKESGQDDLKGSFQLEMLCVSLTFLQFSKFGV